MLLAILATCSPEELEEMDEEEEDMAVDLELPSSDIAVRKQQIKNKILAVGKMQRVFQLLRCVHRVWSCTTRPCFHDTGRWSRVSYRSSMRCVRPRVIYDGLPTCFFDISSIELIADTAGY